MARADRHSRAIEQQAKEAALPKCGWRTSSGQTCTHPMPCPFHANARKRKALEDAAREKQRLPQCGFICRDGTACTNIVPCPAHAVEQGMKDCSSTLDGNPFTRCRKKVKVGGALLRVP